MKGKIEQIISRSLHKKGDKQGWITVAVVAGETVSGYSLHQDDFKVGEQVVYFFDERWNKAKMVKFVDKSIDNNATL